MEPSIDTVNIGKREVLPESGPEHLGQMLTVRDGDELVVIYYFL